MNIDQLNRESSIKLYIGNNAPFHSKPLRAYNLQEMYVDEYYPCIVIL